MSDEYEILVKILREMWDQGRTKSKIYIDITKRCETIFFTLLNFNEIS